MNIITKSFTVLLFVIIKVITQLKNIQTKQTN